MMVCLTTHICVTQPQWVNNVGHTDLSNMASLGHNELMIWDLENIISFTSAAPYEKLDYRMPTPWIYTPPLPPIPHTVMRWNIITWIMGMIICTKYAKQEMFTNPWLTPFGHWSMIFTHDSIAHENHCLNLTQWWPNKCSSLHVMYNCIYTGPYTREGSGLRQLIGTSDRFPPNEPK